MKWKIQYRKKGDNAIKTEVVDLLLTNREQVKNWVLSTKTTKYKSHLYGDWPNSFVEGDKKDIEFINAKIINEKAKK